MPRTHLVAVLAISVVVGLIAIVAPSGEVEANRAPEPAAAGAADGTPRAPAELVERIADALETRGDAAPSSAEARPGDAAAPAIPEAPESAAAGATDEQRLETADAAPEVPGTDPRWQDITVRSGDNLSLIFQRAGFTDRDVYRVMTADGAKALTRLFPGETIAFRADDRGDLIAVRHVLSRLEHVDYLREAGGFRSKRFLREPELRVASASGTIESSLFVAGQDAGLSINLIMELAGIFGGVIDFVMDPRKGDTIHLLYEEQWLDGEKYADGRILAASMTNRGETFNAYRYRDSNGQESFYNENGVSMRKAFLLAPVDFTRISSNFNLRRMHPIYKTTRPHRGTDYAAPRGTPVYAAGDGRVIEAGYTRANGNYVFLQHGARYVTKYLHLNKRMVRRGQVVEQSQVIGTVGATGAATGPHLHYEFLVDGVHRNPRTIHKELPKAKALDPAELPTFQLAIAEPSRQLALLQRQTRLAQAGTDSPSDTH